MFESKDRGQKRATSRSLLSTLLPILFWLTLTGSALAQSDQSVYSDALANGWQNWSWATVNLSNGAPVQAGVASVAVSAGAWQAPFLHHNAFDSSLYTNLTFRIHGGSTGRQLLQVQAELNGASQTVVTLPPLAANTRLVCSSSTRARAMHSTQVSR